MPIQCDGNNHGPVLPERYNFPARNPRAVGVLSASAPGLEAVSAQRNFSTEVMP